MTNKTIYKKMDVIVADLQHLFRAPSKYVKKDKKRGGFDNQLFLVEFCRFESGVECRTSKYHVKEAEMCLTFLKRQEDIDKFNKIIKLAKQLRED